MCGQKWGVTNTIPSGTSVDRANLLKNGRRIASWYCDDFVVRVRNCRNCGHRKLTIELILCDIKKMFEIVSKEGITVITGGTDEDKKRDSS